MAFKTSFYKYIYFLLFFVFLLSTGKIAKSQTILFIGDSITEGLGLEPGQAYPYHLQKMLEKKGIKIDILVDGISGSTSASAYSRLMAASSQNFDYLFLALGFNDGLRGMPPKAMQNNLEKAIATAFSNNKKVILAGALIPENYGQSYSKSFAKVFQDIASANKGRKDFYFFPFLLQDVALQPNLNQSDGIHPSIAGQEVIARNLLKFFENNIF